MHERVPEESEGTPDPEIVVREGWLAESIHLTQPIHRDISPNHGLDSFGVRGRPRNTAR